MHPFIGKAIGVLHRSLTAAGGESVVYRRGNESIPTLSVVFLRSEHVAAGDEEIRISSREADVLIWRENLVIGGSITEPLRGDEIDRTLPNGRKATYRILPRDDDSRVFRHTDQTELQFRAYATEIPLNIETP